MTGRRLTGTVVRNAALRWPVELPPALVGTTVERIDRRGKYLLLRFAAGTLIVHLGMSGSLRVLEPGAEVLTHDHVDLEFDRRVVRLNDPRRFGCVLFHPGEDAGRHWLLEHLGLEPLSNEFHGTYLFEATRNRKVAIKNLIMDSKIVVGVGNIYASEALFLAGIRPGVAARRVTRSACDDLAGAIRKVLSDAIRQGGTTLRDFVGADGKPGYFRQRLNVYGREGEPCRVCEQPVRHRVIGQRSSFYCSKCQTGQGFSPVIC